MALPNTNFTTLIATTLQNFGNKILDNVTTHITLTRFLKEKGNIKISAGGRQFIHQLLYQKNTSFGARSSMDTIDLPVTDPITASEWEIKVLSGSIVLPELDIAKNAGSKEKLLDYANAKRMEAEVSMAELLSDQIWKTSTGDNDFDSVPEIVNTVPTVAVGGINGSAQAFWRNVIYGTTVTGFATANEGINAIDTALMDATHGTQGPKLIVTTKAIFTLYNNSLSSNVRYTNTKSGDAGFRTLLYADLPFVADADCPSGRLYGIDTENLKLQVLSQGNFGQSPFKWATNQLAQSSLMYLFANLTCGSRRTNFVINSITG